MFAPLRPIRALIAAAGALRADLVPGDEDSDRHRHALERQVAQLAAIWPLALIALAAVPLVLWYVAVRPTEAALAGAMQLRGTIILAIGLAELLMLRLTRFRWSPQVRIRLSTASGVAIAIGLMAILAMSTVLSPPPRLAAVVLVFGAVIAMVVALHPVRAATLGFGAALVCAIAAQTGFGMATLGGTVFLLGLAVASYRLVLIDRADIAEAERRELGGHMATKLVQEFEAHSTGWFWQADAQGRVTYLSAKVASELATDPQAVIGTALTSLFRMDSATPETERTLAFHMSARTAFSNYSVRPAGAARLERWWSMSGRPVSDEFGRFAGFIGSGTDLTERRRADAEITRLALFDALTGLANRQRMRLSLDQTLHRQGVGHRLPALFLLDLDRFKAVNDTLGHQVGDALLKQVAQRLQRTIGDAGLVGRLGGDEFQVILPGEACRDRLADLAREVIATLSQPYVVEGSTITIGCSIGIALAPEDGTDAETLVRNADLALYAAKGDGRGIHRFFRARLLEGAQSRKQLEDDLRHALAQDQFYVAYQPVVSSSTEQIVGYEALLRWDHPTRGAISPAEFVPVAEDCGLIEAIGEWVMRTACAEAATWPGAIRVAVNVSPIQFANPALPAIVTSALAKSGIAPQRLELEITEGVFLDEIASSEQMFRMLKGLGVRLALDDFGTGYSSLGYLKKAPFDKIKIDQSFVRGAAIPGNRNAAIIKAIVTLADTLGMETTAEGVEVQDEIALVRELGCSHIQGYVYGKAVRAADVREQLTVGNGLATASGFRVSRSPRTTMLRSARITIGDTAGEVRIRNMSATGAMIDGIEIDGEAGYLEVLIELLEDQMFPARLRWARDGKAGIEFAQHFNLERLNPPDAAVSLRRA